MVRASSRVASFASRFAFRVSNSWESVPALAASSSALFRAESHSDFTRSSSSSSILIRASRGAVCSRAEAASVERSAQRSRRSSASMHFVAKCALAASSCLFLSWRTPQTPHSRCRNLDLSWDMAMISCKWQRNIRIFSKTQRLDAISQGRTSTWRPSTKLTLMRLDNAATAFSASSRTWETYSHASPSSRSLRE